MQILFLSSIYPRAYDPTRGIYCYRLCTQLAKRHHVRVVSPLSFLERRPRGPLDDQFVLEVGPTTYPRYYYTPRLLRSQYGRFMWLSVKGHVRRLLREFAPDCVLSYWAHPDGEVAVRAAQLAEAPCGVIVGGSDVHVLAKDPGRGPAVARTLRSADAVFAVSQELRDRIVELAVSPDRVHVHYQGIDEQFSIGDKSAARRRLGMRSDRPVLLWVGRMVPVKGLEVLLAACAELRARGRDFELVLAGDGPLRGRLEAQAADLGLSGSMRFVGMRPHEELPDWYRAADLTVLPSYSEGLPNVLRESLACGTPYVATQVGGVGELSTDPANRLVPPGDPASFAGAVAAALSGPTGLSHPPKFHDWGTHATSLIRVLRPDLVPT